MSLGEREIGDFVVRVGRGRLGLLVGVDVLLVPPEFRRASFRGIEAMWGSSRPLTTACRALSTGLWERACFRSEMSGLFQ